MNHLLNQKIKSGLTFPQIRDLAFDSADSQVISFVNPFSYYEIADKPNLVENIDHFFSDGALLCKLHNLFLPKITRASFDYSSIAESFLMHVTSLNKRIAIIGATDDENATAVKVLKSQYPSLNVVYHRNGYIENKDVVAKELNDIQADVILVGMGTPYQEQLSIYLKHALNNPAVIITCGGFLTQTSIKPDYYHPLVKKTGLRWLQRMIMHKHVRERVLKKYPKFVFTYLWEMLKSAQR